MIALLAAAPAGVPELTGLVGWIVDLIAAVGAVGVGIAVALEVVIPPIPSEVVLPLAGFLAGRGELGYWPAVVWSTAGSLAGALGAYWLGAALGRERVGRLWARIPLSEPEDLDRADAWFADHQRRAVFFGRFVPVVRSLISVPAGVAHMPLPTFVLYTALGSAIWNVVFITLGYELGARWRSVGRYSDVLNLVTLVVVVVVVGWSAGRRIRHRRDLRWRGSRPGRTRPDPGRAARRSR